jgi:hypothetical protein
MMQIDSLNNPILIGVYIASITAITSALTNLITSCISNVSQNRRDKVNWLRSEMQKIYSNCIQNLAAVTTLSFAVESNLDDIERSLIEAKKWLALILIYTKSRRSKYFSDFEKEVFLFTSGEYLKFLKEAESKNLYPSSRYENKENGEVCGAAQVMLRRVIEISSKDKRLAL